MLAFCWETSCPLADRNRLCIVEGGRGACASIPLVIMALGAMVTHRVAPPIRASHLMHPQTNLPPAQDDSRALFCEHALPLVAATPAGPSHDIDMSRRAARSSVRVRYACRHSEHSLSLSLSLVICGKSGLSASAWPPASRLGLLRRRLTRTGQTKTQPGLQVPYSSHRGPAQGVDQRGEPTAPLPELVFFFNQLLSGQLCHCRCA